MNTVVIGASQGLGLELLRSLLREGHAVVAGVIEREPPAAVAALAAGSGGLLTVLHADVTDEAGIAAVAAAVADRFGPQGLDALVNVAGVLLRNDKVCDLLTADIAELRRSLDVNAVGAVIVLQHFYPIFRKDGRGVLLTVTSEAGSMTVNGRIYPAYSISKAAANKAVAVMNQTVSDVRILAVHPGRMNTEMGRVHAQIEPAVSADAIVRLMAGVVVPAAGAGWFVNYLGEPMTI